MVSADHSSTRTSCVSSLIMVPENWRSLVIEAILPARISRWKMGAHEVFLESLRPVTTNFILEAIRHW